MPKLSLGAHAYSEVCTQQRINPYENTGRATCQSPKELTIAGEQGLGPGSGQNTFSHQKTNGGTASEEKEELAVDKPAQTPLYAPATSSRGGRKNRHL